MNVRRYCMWIAVIAAVAAAGCWITEERGEGEEGDGFTFVTIGDNRSGEPITQPQAYRDCIKLINALDPQPEFVVNVGDFILGYTDDPELVTKEWDEFDSVTKLIKVPVHMAPGNHDIWNEEARAVYAERYGRTYYSFDHRDSHFICLSTEEADEAGTIAGEQLKWLAEDLEASRDAAHKFAFLHRPLWGEHRGMNASGWNENVHPLLVKHGVDAVYAGHDHQYLNYGVQDGVQYYVTGGGGAGTSGIRQAGGFHHFMVTTVSGEQVDSVVIETDGNVLPDTFVTSESADAFRKIAGIMAFPGVKLPEEGDQVSITNTIKNPLEGRMVVSYEWDATGTAWRMQPAKGKITLGPGEQSEMKLLATFDRDRVMPVPVLRGTVHLDGAKVSDIETRFQPMVSKTATAVRVGKSPAVNGVIADGEYGKAESNGGFVDYRGWGFPEYATAFRLAYDDRALYVAVKAVEPEPDGITVAPRERDGDIWQDDDIELFVDATFDRKTYHQFAVNLDSVQMDAIGGPDHGQFGDPKWNAEWQAAAKLGADAYVVEIAIPFAALGVDPPKPGDTWGLNICRQRQAGNSMRDDPEMSAWSIPYANFHVPTHFGTVTFE